MIKKHEFISEIIYIGFKIVFEIFFQKLKTTYGRGESTSHIYKTLILII